MRIALLEMTCPDIRALGVRFISSYLKKHGQECRLVFLPPPTELVRFHTGEVFQYPEKIMEGAVRAAEGCDLIGLSFMTYYFDRAVQLTKYLREHTDAKIIWGGIHPTIRPEESLDFADIVCIGEGEETLLELMTRMERGADYSDIRGIAVRKNGRPVVNPYRPLVSNLDEIPFPDYDIEDHWCYDSRSDEVVPLSKTLLKKIMMQGPISPLGDKTYYHYKTMATRGCPHDCNYCCNSIYREMYGSGGYFRWRNVDLVMEELKRIIARFPWINAICFFDDTFFGQKTERILEFCGKYKEQIGLPLAMQSSPRTTTLDKIEPMLDAGMVYLEMGLQSGSDRINMMYNRTMKKDEVVRAAGVINRFGKEMLPPDYHIILDNPWETSEDVMDTLNLVLDLPRPFGLKPSSLVLYPGTGVYRKAKEEGMLEDEMNEVYRKAFGAPKPTYLNTLIILVNFNWIPRFLLRIASKKPFVKLFHRPSFMKPCVWITMLANMCSMFGRGAGALLHGDFARIKRKIVSLRADSG